MWVVMMLSRWGDVELESKIDPAITFPMNIQENGSYIGFLPVFSDKDAALKCAKGNEDWVVEIRVREAGV